MLRCIARMLWPRFRASFAASSGGAIRGRMPSRGTTRTSCPLMTSASADGYSPPSSLLAVHAHFRRDRARWHIGQSAESSNNRHVFRHVFRHVLRHVCRYVFRHVSSAYMLKYMPAHMSTHMFKHKMPQSSFCSMRIGCVEACVQTCVDMRIDMCLDMCMDMYKDMWIDMCTYMTSASLYTVLVSVQTCVQQQRQKQRQPQQWPHTATTLHPASDAASSPGATRQPLWLVCWRDAVSARSRPCKPPKHVLPACFFLKKKLRPCDRELQKNRNVPTPSHQTVVGVWRSGLGQGGPQASMDPDGALA